MTSNPINLDPDVSRGRPASSPEARNNQLISLATDLAERQLIAGTASAQVITHYLKESSLRTQLELEKLRRETALLASRDRREQSMQNSEALAKEALEAMRSYSGHEDD